MYRLRRCCLSQLFQPMVVCLFVLPILATCNITTGLAEQTTDSRTPATDQDELELLRLHEAVLAAHRNNDLDSWMQDETDGYVMVSRGEVLHPDKQSRRARLGAYLSSTTFQKYADRIDPQVRVSSDGTLGWVIAQVHIVGTRRMPDGSRVDFDDTWAWIELYEKQDGRWLRVGNVSNRRPE